MNVFDRRAVRLHRDRAAQDGWDDHNFLFRESATRLAERLCDIKRVFPLALDLGCHGGGMAEALAGYPSVGHLLSCDLSWPMARRAGKGAFVADEEALPVAAGCLDLIVSNLSLHWVNDLPGAFLQARQALKPDGLLLGAVLGGATLSELRHSLAEAEAETTGGASPRVSPFADIKDIGDLLQRAGFALPVVDREIIPVSYAEPWKLLLDLRGMGESGAAWARRKSFTRRDTLARAMDIYRERFADADGRAPATFQIIHFAAWAPDPTKQQQPLSPGQAQSLLANALNGTGEA